jgi:DNA (cytosine-5)-methyltransferase 1
MTFGSLFAGIGGLDLGLERTGIACQWQVEKDAHCNTILARHWPKVERFEDVTKFGIGHAVDLICGGFPCQDLSVAGRRAGLAGKRSSLFYEFMRIVDLYSPKWVLIENVPGLLSSNKGRDMGAVVGSLAERGYGWAYRVLDSQYFGLAQRRKRVFIVGYFGDARRAAKVLFEPESLPWDSPPCREERKRVADTLESRTLGGGFPGTDGACDGHVIAEREREREREISKALSTGGYFDATAETFIVSGQGYWNESEQAETLGTQGRALYDSTAVVASPLCAGYAKGSGHNDGKKGSPQNLILDNSNGSVRRILGSTTESNGSSRPRGDTEVLPDNNGDGQARIFETRIGRSGRGQPSEIRPTLKGSEAGETSDMRPVTFGSKSGIRRLTPTECERLQGFPDGWTEGLSDSAQYRCLGNAVSVPVAQWIGKRIMEANPG